MSDLKDTDTTAHGGKDMHIEERPKRWRLNLDKIRTAMAGRIPLDSRLGANIFTVVVCIIVVVFAFMSGGQYTIMRWQRDHISEVRAENKELMINNSRLKIRLAKLDRVGAHGLTYAEMWERGTYWSRQHSDCSDELDEVKAEKAKLDKRKVTLLSQVETIGQWLSEEEINVIGSAFYNVNEGDLTELEFTKEQWLNILLLLDHELTVDDWASYEQWDNLALWRYWIELSLKQNYPDSVSNPEEFLNVMTKRMNSTSLEHAQPSEQYPNGFYQTQLEAWRVHFEALAAAEPAVVEQGQ
ncbi:hypothetical protein KJ910_02300 [Patescibacteria group bacterium]|nr:hypothetical protein [Patescibacteria group bacterium]MBU1906849.1 hypothetical protein [Patescibacteria group bacterium]